MNDCYGCEFWEDGLCDGSDKEAYCPALFVGPDDEVETKLVEDCIYEDIY